MTNQVSTRVRVPKTATAGEIIQIKTLITHPMESGWRRDADGNVVPRSIIASFTCDFNGEQVVHVTMDSPIATNPYMQFEAKVQESGTFTFTWIEEDGDVYTDQRDITVA